MITRIYIDLDEILNRIYAESARRALCAPDVPLLSADQSRLLEQYIESGFREVQVRIGGYVALASFNPNSDDNNIILHLQLRHNSGEPLSQLLHYALVELLAHYALMRFYGDEGTWYGTAWRKYRAQVLLMLARDQMALDATAEV
ncbi:MAG: hypothetical protein IKR71_00745 [Bacteroidales bacterium]|nr:hypothetical protein [Bacteroidales bacterium]